MATGSSFDMSDNVGIVAPFLSELAAYTKPVWGHFEPYAASARLGINSRCKNLEAWQIISASIGAVLIVQSIQRFLFKRDQSLVTRVKSSGLKLIRRLPVIGEKIEGQIAEQAADMEASFHKHTKGQQYITTLPSIGLTEFDVKLLPSCREDVKLLLATARASGIKKLAHNQHVYNLFIDLLGETRLPSFTGNNGDKTLVYACFIKQLMLTGMEELAQVYADFAWTNPLHSDVFPDVRKMEAEVVRMVCNMFNGSAESCGCMTSGGTESILMACKAYRDRAISLGIEHPEMIVPETAHAAFDKAAGYFQIKITHIPVDPVTRQVNVAAMKRAISRRTCMLVGSAPQFPHGVLDPIVEIAKLGKKYNIPVHVDSCLGGFLVPFMEKAGFDIEPFDFRVDGVTSISADTHKYGFAPKGSSVILYSDKEYRKYQYFVAPHWPGGVYASPTVSGSRAGAIIAACWVTMMHMGENGYIESTRKIVETTRYIESELRKVLGVFVYGKPATSVVAVGSEVFNIYRLSDALVKRGWNLNALQYPSSIHLCVTLVHTKPGIAQKFVTDFKQCTEEIMKTPQAEATGQAAMYGMAQSVPQAIVSEIAQAFFDAYYSTEVNKSSASKSKKSD